jgi:hypothetical protein
LIDTVLYFEADSGQYFAERTNSEIHKTVQIDCSLISIVLKRRYLHEDTAVEIFTRAGLSYFFNFTIPDVRTALFRVLREFHTIRYIQADPNPSIPTSFRLFQRWSVGHLTNYEYLWWLNILSGRSIHDLSQYPVMPWVVSEYDSAVLSLSDPSNFRDLSLPIGVLNEERIDELMRDYEESKGTAYESIYRVHYSTAAYVALFLIRVEPFTSIHIALQRGRFDDVHRVFTSIPDVWRSVVSTNRDVRELIPEFFATPEFLLNSEHFDLGPGHDDVVLPPWASTAAAFVILNRRALESAFVSRHLHKWIDLIFGYKQSGDEAVKARNVFHPDSYSGSLARRPEDREAIQAHAANFGVVPEQLFWRPHPERKFAPDHPRFAPKATFRPYLKCNPGIVKIAFVGSHLWVALSSGEMKVYNGEEVEKTLWVLSLTWSTSRLVCIQNETIIVGGPWSRTCDLVFFTSRTRNPQPATRHLGRISAFDVGANADFTILVTVSDDWSMCIYDLFGTTPVSCVMAHRNPVCDVSCSADLSMIASVDVEGEVILSDLRTGRFIRRPCVHKNGKRVFLIREGVLVVLVSDGGGTTKLIARDLAGHELGEVVVAGETVCGCVMEYSDFSCCLAVVQSTDDLFVFRDYDLELLSHGLVPMGTREIAFSTEMGALVIAVADGTIYWVTLDGMEGPPTP